MRSDLYQYLTVFTAITFRLALCQEWTWLGGDKIIDKLSARGYPGGRSGSSVWSSNEVVWMFGGNGYTDVGTGKSHLLNDVWSFNPRTTQFTLQNPGTWMLNSDPSLPSSVVPAERRHAAMCGYQDKLFVFGGFGEAGVALVDLWVFDTSSRVWLEQPLYSNGSSWGPPARGHSAVWCSQSSMFIYGGLDDNSTILADMWALDLLAVAWTRLGSKPRDLRPTGRSGAVAWATADTLYMFGGHTLATSSLQTAVGLTSDLWGYHLGNSSWHMFPWQEGSTGLPSARVGSAAWTDSDGNLWLFAGAGTGNNKQDTSYHFSQLLSDMWMFDVHAQTWNFIGGSSSGKASARYGDRGEMDKTNSPGARTEMMAWAGGDNQVYVFGGVGYDETHFAGYLNDLWRADLTGVVSREYLVPPLLLLLFFGVASSLLVVTVVLALCSRQSHVSRGGRLQFKLSPEYYRLDSDVS